MRTPRVFVLLGALLVIGCSSESSDQKHERPQGTPRSATTSPTPPPAEEDDVIRIKGSHDDVAAPSTRSPTDKERIRRLIHELRHPRPATPPTARVVAPAPGTPADVVAGLEKQKRRTRRQLEDAHRDAAELQALRAKEKGLDSQGFSREELDRRSQELSQEFLSKVREHDARAGRAPVSDGDAGESVASKLYREGVAAQDAQDYERASLIFWKIPKFGDAAAHARYCDAALRYVRYMAGYRDRAAGREQEEKDDAQQREEWRVYYDDLYKRTEQTATDQSELDAVLIGAQNKFEALDRRAAQRREAADGDEAQAKEEDQALKEASAQYDKAIGKERAR